MIEKKVEIKNKYGLHARPAAQFVRTASKFKSNVFLSREEHEVNGKSIMGVMMLAAQVGSFLTISVSGDDEKEAIDAILKIEIKGDDKEDEQLLEPLFEVVDKNTEPKNDRPKQ